MERPVWQQQKPKYTEQFFVNLGPVLDDEPIKVQFSTGYSLSDQQILPSINPKDDYWSHNFILLTSSNNQISKSPIFCLLAWSTLGRDTLQFINWNYATFSNSFYISKKPQNVFSESLKKSKQKFCCKYWGFRIQKFGCSMTWARYVN